MIDGTNVFDLPESAGSKYWNFPALNSSFRYRHRNFQRADLRFQDTGGQSLKMNVQLPTRGVTMRTLFSKHRGTATESVSQFFLESICPTNEKRRILVSRSQDLEQAARRGFEQGAYSLGHSRTSKRDMSLAVFVLLGMDPAFM